MGNSQRHALPRERRLYVVEESVFGTIVHPAGTDAFRARNFQPGSPTTERLKRDDNRDTRSTEEHITAKQAPAEWSFESYVLPSGTAGTPPDLSAFLTAAFGVYTNTPATSDAYTLTDTQGAQRSFSIVDQISQVAMTQLVGAVIQSLNIKGAGGDPPVFTVSGIAKDHLTTGRDVTDGAVVGSNVPVSEPDNFAVGSRIAFYAPDGTVRDDDTGDGFVVTAVNAGDIDVDSAPVGIVIGDTVAPFQPTPVTTGSAIPGVIATLKIDHGAGQVTLPVLSYDFTLNNNHVPFADEAGQLQITDWVEDFREVSGQFVLRARADQIHLLNKRRAFATHDVELVLGDTAGRTVTLDMPTAELGFNDSDYAAGDSAKITLPLMGLGTQNEISLRFT